jgi:hypothetical protein
MRAQTDSLRTLRLPICRRGQDRGIGASFSPITTPAPQKQRPPRGAAFERRECAFGFHSMPGESRLLRDRRKPATPRPHTQSAISAHADDSDDA